eukprot:COSAG05_NODE_4476_length_1498_cov_1.114367_2_plen_43_part_00
MWSALALAVGHLEGLHELLFVEHAVARRVELLEQRGPAVAVA